MTTRQRIDSEHFPKQGTHLNRLVEVTFNREAGWEQWTIGGKIVRDDVEGEYLTIILLDDGRVIMGTECTYHFIAGAAA